MAKPVYRKLIITALVTSVAFGAFAVLNFYIFREIGPSLPVNKRILHVRPEFPLPSNPIHVGRKTGASNHNLFIIRTGLYITGGMLIVWLINIGTLLTNRNTLVRYLTSYVVIMLVMITVIYLFGEKTQAIPTPTFKMRFELTQLPFMTAIIINTIVLSILELILVQHHKSRIELENTQLKMNHLLAHHQHLQHQLHPHFLFNSLNTLKSLIRVSATEAEEYLLRLSFFLRASLARDKRSLVHLEEELQSCMYYLDMQKIRYGQAFNYVIQVPETVASAVCVPAYSIQLLVENAIKHNAFTIDCPLTIQINYDEKGYIQVKNNKNIRSFKEPSSSIGLKNLSERYRMIAGEDIAIDTDESHFIVTIKAIKK
jgi:two-component system LytT family sensor kinase